MDICNKWQLHLVSTMQKGNPALGAQVQRSTSLEVKCALPFSWVPAAVQKELSLLSRASLQSRCSSGLAEGILRLLSDLVSELPHPPAAVQ